MYALLKRFKKNVIWGKVESVVNVDGLTQPVVTKISIQVIMYPLNSFFSKIGIRTKQCATNHIVKVGDFIDDFSVVDVTEYKNFLLLTLKA